MIFVQLFGFVGLASLKQVEALSATSSYNSNVYWNQYTAAQQLDQAAYESPSFWKEIDTNLPQWRTSSKYERFRGFCNNLRTKEPGQVEILSNGQQVLSQYMYPGINAEDAPRSAYPSEQYKELESLQKRLKESVAPVGKKELRELLEARPLVDDDGEAQSGEQDGDTWQRAAWYGWQFPSMRGAKRFMPQTTKALRTALGGSTSFGPAHRFVGLARQKQGCKGVEHSDGRNYMLSTLTPLHCPEGCGIVVDGIDAKLENDGSPVILDNTFLHHVYNHADDDRFCLMSEIYHPALSPLERDAIATLFAVKDRFTVTELRLAPWGYDDDALAEALSNGAIYEIDFWKEIGYSHPTQASSRVTKKSKKERTARGFGK